MKMKYRVLAVLALALLIINMLPVKRAEAATTTDGKYYVDFISELNWGSYESERDSVLSYKYIFVQGGPNYYSYRFSNEPFVIQDGRMIMYDDFFISVNRVSKGINAFYDYRGKNFSSYIDSAFSGGEYVGTNYDFSGTEYAGYPSKNIQWGPPEPVTLPVYELNYTYWLYHKTTSGEYMYWSKDPFDLEVSEGKYILNLSTGDIVYRLHMNPSHTYYRQILSRETQYAVSPGDVFRSGQELVFDDITIEAWTSGDVASEEVEKPIYDIPHITKFLTRIRSARSYADKPREYSMSIDLALSGDFDESVTEQKVLIDGNYFLPSEEYFRYCDAEGIEPSTTHFMKYVKGKQDEYYILVDWSHIETIVNLAGLTSDFGFRLTYSNAIDALIERGEFDELYSKSVQAAYSDDIRKLCCPYRLACTLIGVVDGEYYYGDTFITVLYSELDSNTEDVSGVYSDYVSLDNDQRTDAIESTINDAQGDQLQEYIDKKDAELDALIEEYEMKLAALDTSTSFGGTGDLFTTFSSVANGIAGLSGSFRKIAVAVGNVFAFFPEEITGILFAGIVVMIVIAVYKALRG